jgi:hypothetical protein
MPFQGACWFSHSFIPFTVNAFIYISVYDFFRGTRLLRQPSAKPP